LYVDHLDQANPHKLDVLIDLRNIKKEKL